MASFAIAIPEKNRYEDYKYTTIHGRVLLSGDPVPGLCCYLPYSYAPTIRRSFFPWGKRSQNWHSTCDGGILLDGEPLEFKALVGSNVLLMVKAHPEIVQFEPRPRRVSSWGSSGNDFWVGGPPHKDLGTLPHYTPSMAEESGIIVIKEEKYDTFFTKPYTFFAEKKNDEIELHLEKATPITGKVRYANGEPAAGVGIGAKQFVPPARGADIPELREHPIVGVTTFADENGDFELQVWSGKFTLFTGGTEWSEHVTKTIFVESGKPVEADVTIPTPLRIHIVKPDGSPAGNFQYSQLTVHGRASWNETTGTFIPHVKIRTYNHFGKMQPEHPIAMNLNDKDSYAENYIAVMTADNEFGIVRKLEPELMEQELTLSLRPTIAGTVRLIDKSKRPVANQDVTVWMRMIKMDNSNSYVEQSANFARKLWFRTDAEDRGHFKVPVFEEVSDTVSLFFNGGADQRKSSLPLWTTGWLRNSCVEDKFKMFRPPADGKPFDLGVMEIER